MSVQQIHKGTVLKETTTSVWWNSGSLRHPQKHKPRHCFNLSRFLIVSVLLLPAVQKFSHRQREGGAGLRAQVRVSGQDVPVPLQPGQPEGGDTHAPLPPESRDPRDGVELPRLPALPCHAGIRCQEKRVRLRVM